MHITTKKAMQQASLPRQGPSVQVKLNGKFDSQSSRLNSAQNRPNYTLPTLKSHTKQLSGQSISSSLTENARNHSPDIQIIESTKEPKYHQLQAKARTSYKKILKTGGKLNKQAWAFFYISNTKAAAQGGHFKKIADLKQGMNEFRTQWINFNQPLDTVAKDPRLLVKPTVLVVADEVFMMPDKPLSQLSRLSVPNTLKESNMVFTNQQNRQNPNYRPPQGLQSAKLAERELQSSRAVAGHLNTMNALIEKSELQRQQVQWHATGNVVQGHLFDGQLESKDISVFDYLMKFGHDIISFKMVERLMDCWHSQKVEWHIKRGLKVNMDGSPCLEGRPITIEQVNQLNQMQKKGQAREIKMQTFCVSFCIPGTQTAFMACQGMPSNQHTYAHDCHFFQANTIQQQQQLKMNLGPGVYVGKYDIHHTNFNAPLGTSIFQLQREREFADQNCKFLNQKYMENVKKQQSKLTIEQKRPPVIEEPKPGPAHVICAVCKEKFTDYYQHIFSARHKRGVMANMSIFDQVDSVIKDIAVKQRQKTETHIQNLLNIQGQKIQVNNPEESSKSGNNCCVSTEDPSQVLTAQKKVLKLGMTQEGINSAGNTSINQLCQMRQRTHGNSTISKPIVTICLDDNVDQSERQVAQTRNLGPNKIQQTLVGSKRQVVEQSSKLHSELMQAASSEEPDLVRKQTQLAQPRPAQSSKYATAVTESLGAPEQENESFEISQRRDLKMQEKRNQKLASISAVTLNLPNQNTLTASQPSSTRLQRPQPSLKFQNGQTPNIASPAVGKKKSQQTPNPLSRPRSIKTRQSSRKE